MSRQALIFLVTLTIHLPKNPQTLKIMNGHLGEIRIVAFNFVPTRFVLCDGRRFKKFARGNAPTPLYEIVGDAYTYDDSDPTTFAIPDLRDRFVLHPETASKLGTKKGKDEVVLSMNQMPEHNHDTYVEADNSASPSVPVDEPKNSFLNNNAGVFASEPSENTFFAGISQVKVGDSTPVKITNAHVKMVYAMCVVDDPQSGAIGEIRIWPNSKTGTQSGSIPDGWMLCNGETLKANSANDALYSIIGTKYGGSIERNEFKLPDFRNKFASGAKKDSSVGETGGATSVSLNKINSHHTHIKSN